jgi:putative flippase GtrA
VNGLLPSGALPRQVIGYGVVGGIQLAVDSLLFVLLTWLGFPVAPSNVAARVAGACLGFVLNHRFTFRHQGRRSARRRAFVRFLVFWVATTAISTLAVDSVDRMAGLQFAWIGKPLVDGLLAVLGFIASKYWIYR